MCSVVAANTLAEGLRLIPQQGDADGGCVVAGLVAGHEHADERRASRDEQHLAARVLRRLGQVDHRRSQDHLARVDAESHGVAQVSQFGMDRHLPALQGAQHPVRGDFADRRVRALEYHGRPGGHGHLFAVLVPDDDIELQRLVLRDEAASR
ncbi:MAG: hypothetical protein OXL34_18825 [Gemmatimonadota bacterium]|nr:hypothetical protein [Gemmatimonadota bacterium]